MLDPISDMLTRIRNAQMAGRKETAIPFSKLRWAIAKVLENEKFIKATVKNKTDKFEFIKIILKYKEISSTQKVPAISGIKRISKDTIENMYIYFILPKLILDLVTGRISTFIPSVG